MTDAIISAGLPRSGSTLLYQLIREVIRRHGATFESVITKGAKATEDALREISQERAVDFVIVKTHAFHPSLAEHPMTRHIFTCFRDPRGMVASYIRLGWTFERALIPKAVPRRLQDLQKWEAAGAISFRYERFFQWRAEAARIICREIFGDDLSNETYQEIAAFCSLENHENWKEAGLNTATGSNWQTDLDRRQKGEIAGMFRRFMLDRGYL